MSLYSFYRPHNRMDTAYTGELVDPATGEVHMPPSRTRQSFAAECDIHNILKQFSKTGMLTHVSAKAAQGAYRDLPDDLDFQTAMQTVMRGKAAFDGLPSALRARFGHDPAQFLDFMSDPENEAEARKLGLLTAVEQGVQGISPAHSSENPINDAGSSPAT